MGCGFWWTEATITGYTNYIFDATFSNDGSTVASGGADNTIHLWNTSTAEEEQILIGHTDWVWSVEYSPDDSTIASGSDDGTIRLWNALTGEHIKTFSGHTHWVWSVAFNPDGSTIASGSEDGTVKLWNTAFDEELFTLSEHRSSVLCVAFSSDGRTLASGSADGTIILWDVATGDLLDTLTGHTDIVECVAFSPKDGILASGSDDGTVRIWDTVFGVELETFTGHTGFVEDVAFSSDGNTLVSGSSDRTIRIWDIVSGKQIQTLIGHTGTIFSIAVNSDDNTIASTSVDGTVLLWNFTPSTNSYATASFSPSSIESPAINWHLTLSLNIEDAGNVAGYQATVRYDETALRFVSGSNGGFLPSGSFSVPVINKENTVTFAATSLGGETFGSGTLANLTFEVIAPKASTLTLSNVRLTDASGNIYYANVQPAHITQPFLQQGDLNGDGVVNVQDLTIVASNFGETGENHADVNGDGVVDIVDLTLVAAAMANSPAAPSLWIPENKVSLTSTVVEQWLRDAKQISVMDTTIQQGILVLEQLLSTMIPKQTVLLPNYPNPFNPETWIPYQLAEPADVTIHIYSNDGQLIRTLDMGHRSTGIYQERNHAVHWDGKNEIGEPIASGIYFYTLTAGQFTATRKMLIRK